MIKIGETIILEPKETDQDEQYKCKLLERKDDKFFIDYPINLLTNRTAYLLRGMQMKATFIGSDGSVYFFETEITGRTKLNNVYVLTISYPGKEELVKIQRRQFVRVETSLDVAVHPTAYEFEPFTTITDDISAGGAAIILPRNTKIKPDQTIKVLFVFPMQSGDYHYVEIKSRIIRFVEINEGRKKASLEFLDIADKERQIILRLCFERQLAMRRRVLR